MAELIVEAMQSLAQAISLGIAIGCMGAGIAMIIFGLGRFFGYLRCGRDT